MTFESKVFELNLKFFQFLMRTFLKLSDFLFKILDLLMLVGFKLSCDFSNLIFACLKKLLMLKLHFLFELHVLKLKTLFLLFFSYELFQKILIFKSESIIQSLVGSDLLNKSSVLSRFDDHCLQKFYKNLQNEKLQNVRFNINFQKLKTELFTIVRK